MIIDGTDLILGRLATVVAKKALLGEKIDIVNCENVVVTGSYRNVLSMFKEKKEKGDIFHGPYFPRMPDRIVRRSIRGMLPYKKEKGKTAFKRVMCHIGVPEEFKDAKLETVENANSSRLDNLKFTALKKICNEMGAKI